MTVSENENGEMSKKGAEYVGMRVQFDLNVVTISEKLSEPHETVTRIIFKSLINLIIFNFFFF